MVGSGKDPKPDLLHSSRSQRYVRFIINPLTDPLIPTTPSVHPGQSMDCYLPLPRLNLESFRFSLQSSQYHFASSREVH